MLLPRYMRTWEMLMESHKCQATGGIQGYQKWCFLRVAADVGVQVGSVLWPPTPARRDQAAYSKVRAQRNRNQRRE